MTNAERDLDLAAVVDALCRANHGCGRSSAEPLPSPDEVIGMMEALRRVLFPGYFGWSELTPETLCYHLGHTLDQVRRTMQTQVKRGLVFAPPQADGGETDTQRRAGAITDAFVERLPQIQALVASDVQAAYEGDPAANSPDEAIFCYPGVLAVTNYRVAHGLHELGVPLLPRMITEHAHSTTGIDIHPGATIGASFFIDHGTGVVIGETCLIGDRVRIYQGVTLGAKSFPLDADGNPVKGIMRHPIIEDDVIIYSGATILGRVTIGKGSVIGGNVWLTRSVPPDSRMTVQAPRQDAFESGGGI